MITAIHYQGYKFGGELETVHRRERLEDFCQACGITLHDLETAKFPWFLPDMGITIIGYEKSAE